MKFKSKSLRTILLTIILLSGLFSLTGERSANALSISGIDLDELNEFDGFEEIDKITGLIDLHGPKGDTGDEGPAGAPCPNTRLVDNPGTMNDYTVCVP